jgi:hypothetical protein
MVKSLVSKDSFSKMIIMETMAVLFLFVVSTSFLHAYAQDSPSVGTVRIITHVINNNGGTKESSDFSNCLDSSRGDSTSMQCSSGDQEGNSESSFDPGAYKITPDPNSSMLGYTASQSKDCSGVVKAGETKICTITYDDIPNPSPSQGAAKK